MRAIILVTGQSIQMSKAIERELGDTVIYTKNDCDGCIAIGSYSKFLLEHFSEFESIIFIGAMGICVRSIAACIKNKYKDPAVLCIDSVGRYVIPVLSGHIGGANELSRRVAAIIGRR